MLIKLSQKPEWELKKGQEDGENQSFLLWDKSIIMRKLTHHGITHTKKVQKNKKEMYFQNEGLVISIR